MRATYIAIAMAIALPAAADPKIAANLEVPTVPYGLDPVPQGRPTVLITTTGIVVEGKTIIAIKEGVVDPSEKDSGSLGIAIPRLTAFVKAITKMGPTGFVVAIDKSLPYRLLVEVVFSIKQAGIRDFAILAHAKELGVVPISLPDKAAPTAGTVTKPSDAPVKLAVAITKDKMLLWSVSGLEGTISKPKLSVAPTDTTRLTAALVEIVKRRFAKQRADGDRSIILMADQATPMQVIANVMIASRKEASGAPLFPELLLATGFE